MGIRILIVEDEPELADFVIRGLREEGFVVEHAADGELGWAAMRSGTWDLVVLDWWLPGEDGLSVLKRYRQAGGTAPVLFLTARDAVTDRVRGLDGGADDYLCKPFAFDELVARVRALGRRATPAAPPVLAVGDLVLDQAKRAVTRSGRPLELTRKEFGILAELVKAGGAVISSEELLERVWDVNADPFTTTVRVTVMTLRKKLGDPPLIETVVGSGYRLPAA